MQFNFNMKSGISQYPKEVNLLNTQQYLEMRHEAIFNDHSQVNPNGEYDLTLWDTTRYIDWQKTFGICWLLLSVRLASACFSFPGFGLTDP